MEEVIGVDKAEDVKFGEKVLKEEVGSTQGQVLLEVVEKKTNSTRRDSSRRGRSMCRRSSIHSRNSTAY